MKEAENKGQQEAEQPLYGSDILINLINEIVPLLIKNATLALQMPDYAGLDFAAILLEEALKYGELYPYAFGMPDDSLHKAAGKLRKRNVVDNPNR